MIHLRHKNKLNILVKAENDKYTHKERHTHNVYIKYKGSVVEVIRMRHSNYHLYFKITIIRYSHSVWRQCAWSKEKCDRDQCWIQSIQLNVKKRCVRIGVQFRFAVGKQKNKQSKREN